MYFTNFMSIDPWQEMENIKQEMNRLFNRAFGAELKAYPPVNIWTNEDKAVVMAELPGYNPDDINLSVLEDTLRIKGSRPKEELKENEQYHRQERGYGEFDRTIRLPFAVESDKVEANFDKGVLKVTLPRAEADKPKKIAIKSN